jgi:hypothetical protein
MVLKTVGFKNSGENKKIVQTFLYELGGKNKDF